MTSHLIQSYYMSYQNLFDTQIISVLASGSPFKLALCLLDILFSSFENLLSDLCIFLASALEQAIFSKEFELI